MKIQESAGEQRVICLSFVVNASAFVTIHKIVSDLRKKVRDRLKREGGEELTIAQGAKETIDKYFAAKDKQYRAMKLN